MKVVSTTNAPAAIGPYSQALDLGNMVFVSGQIPVDPATGTMADTVEQQAAQSLANLKAILAEAGLSMNNVVKTVIFLADINDFAAVNAEYAKAFAEPFPARSCVPVVAAPGWPSSSSSNARPVCRSKDLLSEPDIKSGTPKHPQMLRCPAFLVLFFRLVPHTESHDLSHIHISDPP